MTIASPFTGTDLAATLRASLRGDVVLPADASFGAATFGLAGEGHPPELVVIAADAADVGAVLRLAARTGHRVVLDGAHSPRDDARTILLVTRLLAIVAIDPMARTATIGAGASWRQVIDLAAPFGLAPVSADPGGLQSAGRDQLTALTGRLGLSLDHVRGFELVRPLGEPLTVERDLDPEPFRSLPLAGRSGVITALTIELLPAGALYAGGLFFAAGDAAAVLDRWREWSNLLPASCLTSADWRHLPDLPQVPASVRGRSVLHIRFAHVGDPAAGARLLALFHASTGAAPILDTVEERPWSAVVDEKRWPRRARPVQQTPDHAPTSTRGAGNRPMVACSG